MTRLGLMRGVLRMLLKPALRPRVSITSQRRVLAFTGRLSPLPRGTRLTSLSMDGVAAERVDYERKHASDHGAAAAPRAILYLHGGGYCIGAPQTHRTLAAHLARATGATVYVPDYRLAPEHPHPAALTDAVAAYRWLLAQGLKPEAIALAGDSAGGGLALACAIELRDTLTPLPAAMALLSPWVDLACAGDTMSSHARRDPMLSAEGLRHWAQTYCSSLPLTHPRCSPLHAALHSLPPTLIQVGSEEVLLADSLRLEQRARAAGIDVVLHRYEGLWHDFQLQAGVLREADAAIHEMRDFFDRHWRSLVWPASAGPHISTLSVTSAPSP